MILHGCSDETMCLKESPKDYTGTQANDLLHLKTTAFISWQPISWAQVSGPMTESPFSLGKPVYHSQEAAEEQTIKYPKRQDTLVTWSQNEAATSYLPHMNIPRFPTSRASVLSAVYGSASLIIYQHSIHPSQLTTALTFATLTHPSISASSQPWSTISKGC